jgi:regulator of protease activity HflC (stomatin/prohibitin superfamily)
MIIFNLLWACALPLYLLMIWNIVHPNQQVIVTAFGKVRRVVKDPGCYYNALLNWEYISTKIQTLTLKGSSVPDLKGAPMNVSCIVNYKIVDPVRSKYAVEDYQTYIRN